MSEDTKPEAPPPVEPLKVIAATRSGLISQIGHITTEIRRLTAELHKLESDVDALDKASTLF